MIDNTTIMKVRYCRIITKRKFWQQNEIILSLPSKKFNSGLTFFIKDSLNMILAAGIAEHREPDVDSC